MLLYPWHCAGGVGWFILGAWPAKISRLFNADKTTGQALNLCLDG